MADHSSDANFPIVDLPPEVDSPDAALRFLAAELVRAGRLPEVAVEELIAQVWHREGLGSTAIGGGVAIPHARVDSVSGAVGIIGRCSRALDWPGALDGDPVRVVCLLVVPTGSPPSLLREMERIVRSLRD